MVKSIEVGKHGEELACRYLSSLGHTILFRNWSSRIGEIDIVSRAPDGTLVFCEVKALIETAGGLSPEDVLSAAKLKKMRRAARLFVSLKPRLVRGEKGFRLDAIAIFFPADVEGVLRASSPTIRYYENV